MKKWLVGACFVFLIFLCGLVVEWSARRLFPNHRLGNQQDYLESITNGLWATPHADFHHVVPDFPGWESPASATGDAADLFIVGDSFVWGHGVGKENSFARLLQKKLSPRTVKIYATPSYSPIIYLRLLNGLFASKPPRHLLLLVDASDLADELTYRDDLSSSGDLPQFDPIRMQRRHEAVAAASAKMKESLNDLAWLRRSTLFNLLFPLKLNRFVSPYDPQLDVDRGEVIRKAHLSREAMLASLGPLRQNLQSIAELCNKHGVRLLLAAIPWEIHTSRKPNVTLNIPGPYPVANPIETLLSSESQQWKASFHSLEPTFKIEGNANLYLWRQEDFHWSVLGHQLAAEALLPFLR